ncbi:MAG: DUF721 domain-containing protein [Candidatus Omnitrophica bacterium]|nr:DUF721 domain-containing protein [Candidatus Omnitrophota bacterium]
MEAIRDLLGKVLKDLENPEKQTRQKLVDAWRQIAGPQIAPRTKPSLTEQGKLFVWVETSTLAFEINQKYRQSLLKRTQAVMGEDKVREIYIRVGQLR